MVKPLNAVELQPVVPSIRLAPGRDLASSCPGRLARLLCLRRGQCDQRACPGAGSVSLQFSRRGDRRKPAIDDAGWLPAGLHSTTHLLDRVAGAVVDSSAAQPRRLINPVRRVSSEVLPCRSSAHLRVLFRQRRHGVCLITR